MFKLRSFLLDTEGDAVVEATILFPIMIMIFAAMVLLSIYLPQRMILQEAAQYTATAIATESGDTYVGFDDQGNPVRKDADQSVYVDFIQGVFGHTGGASDKAESIALYYAGKGILSVPGSVEAEYFLKNYVVYQEVTVRLTQTIPVPVNLSFIGFPENLVLVQEASAVVQNGDEFVRNIDIAKDIGIWLDKKLGLSKKLGESGALDKINDVLVYFKLK